jgi:KUP system potassium uptake protein
VTLTMLITTLLTWSWCARAWHLPAPLALARDAVLRRHRPLLVVACAVKFLDGGWFPLALGRCCSC